MYKNFTFRLVAIIFAIALSLGKAYAYNDKIIMRDGRITEVTISQISGNKLVYTPKNNKKQQIEVDLKDVYMYYTDALGNTYITADGKKFTGEKTPVDKNLDVIYLVSGKEIGVIGIKREVDHITYITKERGTNKKNKWVEVPHTVPESEVFMILYKNGMSEIVTPINVKEEMIVAPEPVTQVQPQAVESATPQYKVIFHDVKKGDTLNSLSTRYDVSCHDIIEWNDLPDNTRNSAQLKIGSQLMIYVAITK